MILAPYPISTGPGESALDVVDSATRSGFITMIGAARQRLACGDDGDRRFPLS